VPGRNQAHGNFSIHGNLQTNAYQRNPPAMTTKSNGIQDLRSPTTESPSDIPVESSSTPPPDKSQLAFTFTVDTTQANAATESTPPLPPTPQHRPTVATLPDVSNSQSPSLDLTQLLKTYRIPREHKYAEYIVNELSRGIHPDNLEHSGRSGTRLAPEREDQIIADIQRTCSAIADARTKRLASLITQFENVMRVASLPTDPREVRTLAKEAVGGDPATYVDDIYDALEAASNRVMREQPIREQTLWHRLREAQQFEEKLGKRTRTLEITQLQQFSTPHPIAEAVAYAADVRPTDIVLEPTAGTGNLVEPLFNQQPGPKINLNEIDPRRAAILKINGYDTVTIGDYLQIDASATVILTNPPWGKASRNRALDVPAPWGRFSDISERFIYKNLKDLRDGGRLVAVMPTTILQPSSTGFRNWIEQTHTLRALIQSPPNSYIHRGTTVDSILLVIDKGKFPNAEKPILRLAPAQPLDWTEYADIIEPLAQGGTHARPQTNRHLADSRTTLGNTTAARPLRSPAQPDPGSGLSEFRGPATGTGDVRPQDTRMDPGLVPDSGGATSLDTGGTNAPTDSRTTPELVRQSTRALRPTNVAAARLAEFEDALRSPIFTPYVLRSEISGNPHPRQVVETRSLAGAAAPKLLYKPHPAVYDAHRRAVISDEQFDAIAAAGQAASLGHGYLAADDVGVGKSREIAGAAIDWFESGRCRRILYTSKGEVNLRDFENELRIVLGIPSVQEPPYKLLYLRDFPEAAERAQKKQPYAMPPAYDRAIYLIESHNLTPFRRAIEDLNVDGILADEAHTYKNEDAAIGQTWKSLHRNWLEANRAIAYFSATPATTLDELEYLYGLREWELDGFADWVERKTGHAQKADQEKRKGEPQTADNLSQQVGTDGSEVSKAGRLATLGKALQQAIQAHDEAAIARLRAEIAIFEKDQKRKNWGQNKGSPFHIKVSTAEMEQIMRELKMKGKYGSRDLWRGGVEFAGKEMPLSPKEEQSYNNAILYMRDVERIYEKYKDQNEAKRNFFGITAPLQAAAKRRLFDFRLRRAIDLATRSLAQGKQPVISVININATELREGYIGSAINRINVEKVLMDDNTGEITDLGKIPEAIADKNDLIEREETEFPPSPDPIELIQQHFGKDKVAVITGDESPQIRSRMKEDFQKGIRRIAVISGAGKTGISLHHVPIALDGLFQSVTAGSGRRHLILADYEWSATQFKQELGRVDRAGQITAPEITAITLGSAAEKKFIATIANRMKSLGAVSKGAAESTGTAALEHFELGGDIDNMVVRHMWRSLPNAQKIWFRGKHFIEKWIDGSPHPKDTIEGVGVRDFLLQLQLIPIATGNQIWTHFWNHREQIYSGRAVAEREANRTQKFSGKVLRRTQLQPDLQLFDIEDAGGHRAGILSGMVTEHMHVVQDFLDTVTERIRAGAEEFAIPRKHREYISFTGHDGELISGLRLRPGQLQPIASAFGNSATYQHTPGSALQDLMAGDTIPLHNGWSLRLGKGGEKKGYLLIDGAKLSNTERGDLVLRHGAKYNAVSGGFFFLPQDPATVLHFLERFPIKQQLTSAGQTILLPPAIKPAEPSPATPQKGSTTSLGNESPTHPAETAFTGGRMVDKSEDSHIHLFFHEKPRGALITILAQHAFQYTAATTSWSRERSKNAYHAANRIMLFIHNSHTPDKSKDR
jgi:strawberry notch-like protein/NTP hydrolase family protein